MSNGLATNNKTTLCLTELAQRLKSQGFCINGVHYKCRFGDKCRGAHNPAELKIASHRMDYAKLDKSTINLSEWDKQIRKTLAADAGRLKNPKYISKIHQMDKMPFDELCKFWFAVTKVHRKAVNLLQKGEREAEGYTSIKDIPLFKVDIPNEQYLWDFVAFMQPCEKHVHMMQNKNKTYHVRDVCIGSINCRNGQHSPKDLVCIPDFLEGQCKCPSIRDITERTLELQKQIEEKEAILERTVDSDGFTTVLSKRERNAIEGEIRLLERKIAFTYRRTHLTDYGLIPLARRVAMEEEKVRCPEVEERKTKAKKITKKVFA